jgi:hypothetical protein
MIPLLQSKLLYVGKTMNMKKDDLVSNQGLLIKSDVVYTCTYTTHKHGRMKDSCLNRATVEADTVGM